MKAPDNAAAEAPDPTEALGRHTAALLATARTLEHIDAASLCPGWSRGHVLTHVARNADALARLAQGALTGVPAPMYPGGTAGRNAEIEAGARRPLDDLVADVSASAEALAPSLGRLRSHAVSEWVEMRGGQRIPATALPTLRLREVVYHHVDLDAGFTFDDVEPALVVEFLRDEVDRLAENAAAPPLVLRPDGHPDLVVGVGGPVVTGGPAALLLWLARGSATELTADPLPDLPQGS